MHPSATITSDLHRTRACRVSLARWVVGTLLSLMTLALVYHVLAAAAFDRYADGLLRDLHSVGNRGPTWIGGSLPDSVRDYAERAGVPGSTPPVGVRYTQSVQFRLTPADAWHSLEADQHVDVKNPGFVWSATRRWGFLPLFRVIDAYVNRVGSLKVAVFGSIPAVNVEGSTIARDELLRYLAELPWTPDAMLHNSQLRRAPMDDRSVQVSAATRAGEAAVTFFFNSRGDIVEMRADARGSKENGTIVQRPWRGVFSDYRTIGGRRIPTYGEVGYIYEQGYVAYFKGRIKDYAVVKEW